MKRILFSIVLVLFGFSSFYTNSQATLGALTNIPNTYLNVGAPSGILPISDGSYWYTDIENFRIVKVNSSGEIIRTVGKQGYGEGEFGSQPRGITQDMDGFLYVIESDCKVTKLDSNGGFIESWGECGFADGQMNNPKNIYYDQYSDTLFVSDADTRIQQFTMNGTIIAQIGTFGDGNGQFNNIEGITTDSSGRLYAVDTDHHRVQVFNQTYLPLYPTETYNADSVLLPDGFTTGTTGTGGSGWNPVQQGPDDASVTAGTLVAQDNSWIETTFTTTDYSSITFDYKISGDVGDHLFVCLDSLNCSISGDYFEDVIPVDTLWHSYSFNSADILAGTHTIRLNWFKQSAGVGPEYSAWIDNFSVRPISFYDDFQSLDFPGINWTTDGFGVNWIRDSSTSSPKANNVTSFQSGGIYNNATSWMSKSVNFDIDYALSFDWKVSSEQNYDHLFLCIDDDLGCTNDALPVNNISGLVDWTNVSVSLPAGPHTIIWKYEKDSDFSNGFDGGWVKNIVFEPISSPLSDVATYTFDFTFGSYGLGDGQFVFPNGIGIQSNGNIVVTSQNSYLVKIFDSTGNWLSTFGGSGAGDGQFRLAQKLAIDSADNIYVTDSEDCTIQKFNNTGSFISRFGNASSTSGKIRKPSGVAYDSSGNIYVIDRPQMVSAGRVQKFSSMGNYVSTIIPDSGDASYIIYIDSTDNLYVSNYTTVKKYDLSGNLLLTIGTEGIAGSGDGQFDEARGIAVDNLGYIYVSDWFNNRISKFDSAGNFVTKWGSLGVADGQFDGLNSIAFNSNYDLYVVDSNNNRVQKFTKAGVHIKTITNSFNYPEGIVIDSNDNVFVIESDTNTEYLSSRYQKFDNNDNYLYTFGSLGSGINQFREPVSAAINPISGKLAIVDSSNHRVQIFSEGVRINNVNSSLDVLRSSDDLSLVSSLLDPLEVGIDNISSELTFGNYIVSDLSVDLSTDRDWSIVNATTVPSASKSLLVNLDPVNAPGASATHSIYIVQGVGQNSARICPSASLMSEINQSCSGGYDLIIGTDTNISSVNINGVDYIKIDGLTGTGALGLSITPPTPDGRLKLTPNTSEAGVTQEVVISYIPTSLFIATDTIEFHFEPGAGFVLANTCAGGATVDANGDTTPDGSALIVSNEIYKYTFDAPVDVGPLSFCANVTSPASAGSYSVRLTDDNGTFDSAMYYVGGDNQVFVTANVAPTLSFNIRNIDDNGDTNSCDFGTVSASTSIPNYDSVIDLGAGECGYSLAVGTNAVGGFQTQIVANHELSSGSSNVNPIANAASFLEGVEAYGIANITPAHSGRDPVFGVYDQDIVRDGNFSLALDTATNIPLSAIDFISYTNGVDYQAGTRTDDVTKVIHGIVIGSGTPAGYYNQVITYTTTANF